MIQRLEVEANEMASVVQNRANKQWIRLARDAKTRQIIAYSVGDRSRKNSRKLGAMIPQACRQHTKFYTEQYVVFQGGTMMKGLDVTMSPHESCNPGYIHI